jgi:hypothetical protein
MATPNPVVASSMTMLSSVDIAPKRMVIGSTDERRQHTKLGLLCMGDVSIPARMVSNTTAVAESKFAIAGSNSKIFLLIWGNDQKAKHSIDGLTRTETTNQEIVDGQQQLNRYTIGEKAMPDERDLAKFANAAGQPNQPPRGHAVMRETYDVPIPSPEVLPPIAKERDEAKIRLKLRALAAYAGEDFFYRYPVRDGAGQRYITGPSIKLANNVAREFGNCSVQIRERDIGDAWVFMARFTDNETGFSMERSYRQRKGQQTVKSKDWDRQLDIAYSIGQSKAIRNVIVNALGIYCDFAFEEAQNSLVEKIGKNLAGSRKKALEQLPVELARVERVIGRAAKDWTAPDISQVVAMTKAIADGMATADETFPPIPTAAPEPKPAAGGGGTGSIASPEKISAAQSEVSDSATTEKPTAADNSEPTEPDK